MEDLKILVDRMLEGTTPNAYFYSGNEQSNARNSSIVNTNRLSQESIEER